MFRIAFGVLLPLAGVAAAAPVPKSVIKQPALDGKWEAVEFLIGKNDSLAGNPWVWVIRGEELDALERQGKSKELQEANVGAACSFAVPDPQKPLEMEYRVKTAKFDSRFPGLVVLGQDEFAFCFPFSAGGKRPAEVKPADGVCYVRFKRVAEK